MILALMSGILLRVLFALNGTPDRHSIAGIIVYMVFMSLQINLALAIFNILPIAPLDGSKILYGLLPAGYAKTIFALERYGPFILIGLILIGRVTGVSILGGLIWPFVKFFSKLFAGL